MPEVCLTLLVGVATRKGVWIGADSGSVADTFSISVPARKVWRSGSWIVGMAGDWRALELVQHAAKMPSAPATHSDAHRTIALDVLDAVRAAFRERGFETEQEDDSKWYMLLGTRTRDGRPLLSCLYSDDHNEQVSRAALGIGDEYALGVLDERDDLEPAARVRHALKRTARLYGALRPPYRIESL